MLLAACKLHSRLALLANDSTCISCPDGLLHCSAREHSNPRKQRAYAAAWHEWRGWHEIQGVQELRKIIVRRAALLGQAWYCLAVCTQATIMSDQKRPLRRKSWTQKRKSGLLEPVDQDWKGVLARRRAEEGVPDCSTTSAKSSCPCQACTAMAARPFGAASGPAATSPPAVRDEVGDEKCKGQMGEALTSGRRAASRVAAATSHKMQSLQQAMPVCRASQTSAFP